MTSPSSPRTVPSDVTTRIRDVPRLALTVTEAAEAIGVSVDFFAEHVAGELRIVRRGRKKLVSVRELEGWLDRNSARVFDEVIA